MEQSLEHHVRELRSRLQKVVLVFAVFSAGAFYFSSRLLELLQADLGLDLNALVAYEVIYTRITIALLLGFLISLPFTYYQFLQFVRPGLRRGEYRVLRNYLPFSILLFIGGALFAYEFIVKASLQFFQATTASSGVSAVWGLRNTIGFALKISAFTGVMFQLPVVAVVLAKAGLIDSGTMKSYRNYFVLGVLMLSAVATPPDIVSQVLLTAPVIGLYQFSILLVSRIG